MSTSTETAIAKFVANTETTFDSYQFGRYSEQEVEFYKKLIILENPLFAHEMEWFLEDQNLSDKDDFTVNGWTLNHTKSAKYKSLFVEVWKKGNKKVYVINQSPYSNVCIFEISFFANEKDSLKEFLKDQNLDLKIKTNQVIQQTI